LNHELFPEPGRPIANTTIPFGLRGAVSGAEAAAVGVASGVGST